MAYRNITDAEYQQVKTAVVEKGRTDSTSQRWRGYPNENEAEMAAFEALRSVISYINIVPTSQQLRELGELYIEGYMESMRTSSVSPAAGGKRRRRKTKRTRLQRKM